MANLIQRIHKSNHVNHSNFDLSANVNFTTAPGMLLPVRFDDCLPNSTYKYDISVFARTVQMLVPSFARVMAHFDAFFVPYRLLGTDYQSVIVGDNRGILGNYNNSAFTDSNKTLPYFNLFHFLQKTGGSPQSPNPGVTWYFGGLSDSANFSYNTTTPILLNALGYGIDSYKNQFKLISASYNSNLTKDGALGSSFSAQNASLNRSVLPLQAYQKIYQDFYRNKLWELENKRSYFCFPSETGSDFTESVIGRGLFEMRYKDYDKDRIFGMIPDSNNILSQGISQYASSNLCTNLGLDSPSVLGSSQVPASIPHFLSRDNSASNLPFNVNEGGFAPALVFSSDSSVGSERFKYVQQYTALSNRRMEAFQKFAEITMMNKSDYKSQISAHFGFSVPDASSDYCKFIGGFDVPLNISDVENTTSVNQGMLAGKGVINGSGQSFSVSPTEHGCVMIICYVVPQIDWSNCFIDRSVLRFNRYDFAIPEFDDLGFEPVRMCDICSDLSYYQNLSVTPSTVVGYLPRYWSYKTKLDSNTTGFHNNGGLNFDAYVVSYDFHRIFDNFKSGTLYKAFKSRPSDLDNLFPSSWKSVNDDPFIFSAYISCKASLPLSVDSLPY